MQIRTRESPAVTLRWIEADPTHGHPKIGGPPQLRKSLVDTGRPPVGRKSRVVKELHHDAVSLRFLVPRFRVRGIHFQELPNGLLSSLAVFFWNSIVKYHVAILFPKGN